MRKIVGLVAIAGALSGCAGLVFDNDRSSPGALYFDPLPVIQVSCDKDGAATAALIMLPDPSRPHHVKAKSGWGSANSTVSFSNGMISQFGQETDTKIPETLTALGGIAALGVGKKGATPCKPGSPPVLYPLTVVNGRPTLGPHL